LKNQHTCFAGTYNVAYQFPVYYPAALVIGNKSAIDIDGAALSPSKQDRVSGDISLLIEQAVKSVISQ
jgi:hypothetical protein